MQKFSMFVKKHKKLTVLSVIFLISIFFSTWLSGHGLGASHDIAFHLSRISCLRDNLASGDFLALIHYGPDGYGYANGMFYGNLLLYIPATLMLLTNCSAVFAYKILIFICTFLTALFMYLCVSKISKSKEVGLVGSFLYTGCAYRMSDLVFRGALGEIGAFMFLPLIVLGLYYILMDDHKKWWVFAIGFVGLVESHILSTLIVAVFCLLAIVINVKKLIREKYRIKALLMSVIFGVALGAAFLFPFLEGYLKNDLVASSQILYDTPARATPIQFLFFGGCQHTLGPGTWWPAGIGILLVALGFLRVFFIKQKSKVLRVCDVCLVFAVITLVCSTSIFPWELFPKLHVIQFPWRLFLIASFCLCLADSLLVGLTLNKIKNTKIRWGLVVVVLLISTAPYFLLAFRQAPAKLPGLDGLYTIGAGEYLPSNKVDRDELIVTSQSEITVDLARDWSSISINYNNPYNNAWVELPLNYYYGYVAESENGKNLVALGDAGSVRVELEKGEHSVRVYYEHTLFQKIGVLATTLGALGILYFILLSYPSTSKYLYKVKKKLTHRYHYRPVSKKEIERQKNHKFSFTPKISVVVPMYKTDPRFFGELVDSLRSQTYENWELCLVDGSPSRNAIYEKIVKSDSRIKYLYRGDKKDTGISANTNAAISLSTGDFIGFMDHDDLIAPDCLFEVVEVFNSSKDIDFIYTDEDHISESGKHFLPHFKPDFSKYELLSRNYISHFSVIKKSLLKKVGELDSSLDGAQDYDLILRATGRAKHIIHIPKVLYHWRSHQGSTASGKSAKPWAFEAGKKTLEKYFRGEKIEAIIKESKKVAGIYDVRLKNREREDNFIIISPSSLKNEEKNILISIAAQKDVGAVGCKIVNSNNFVRSAGATYDLKGKVSGRFVGEAKDSLGYLGKLESMQNVSIIPSDCLVVKKELFHQFFEGKEDSEQDIAEFCLKLVKNGYNNVYTPLVTLTMSDTEVLETKIKAPKSPDPFYNTGCKVI